MKRLKPEGAMLDDWCGAWDESNHEGKIALARTYGVTYDTAKHWRSEAGLPRHNGNGHEPHMQVGIDELLSMRPAVNLDFVSFDIETSNLKADFSVLLSAVIKPYGHAPIVFRADNCPEWQNNRSNDFSIVRAVSDELAKHAIIIAHYGERFDTPYLRAKMLHHGLPVLPPMFAIDTWRIAKKNFQVSSRRLANLATYFDVGCKGGVDGQLWCEAAYDGSREAMDEIVRHNIIDTEVLEKLACLTFPYLRAIPRM